MLSLICIVSYLDNFYPTWTGPVGSESRRRGQLKEQPVKKGKHTLEARYALIDTRFNETLSAREKPQ